MAQTVREGIMETDGFEVILKKAEEAVKMTWVPQV